MPDNPTNKPNKNLSEISHLFLSSIRDRSPQPKPQRVPPGAKKSEEKKTGTGAVSPSIDEKRSVPLTSQPSDLTDEEKALVAGISSAPAPKIPPITSVIASHLSDRQLEQTKRYARYLAAEGQRVGLIEVDACDFRLMTFEPGQAGATGSDATTTANFDARAIADSINELNHDVDCWLLLFPNPRLPEARQMLGESDRWTLLTTCDHDGIISSYRTLKGLADLHRPALSLAMLDARHLSQADGVYRKLAGVCSQFLQWTPEPGEAVIDTPGVVEHVIMSCSTGKDKTPATAHWPIVADLLARAKTQPPTQPATFQPTSKIMEESVMAHVSSIVEPVTRVAPKNDPIKDIDEPPIAAFAPVETPEFKPVTEFAFPAINASEPTITTPRTFDLPMPAAVTMATQKPNDDSEVVDLTTTATGQVDLLGAIVQRLRMDVAECAVRPPMCPEARLAVSRDRRLVLLAADNSGLSSLKNIAAAFRWMNENRQLLAMALPQFSIDANQLPQMRLFIDHSDINADLLQPMMQSGSVTVQTYRKIKWGTKTGLLLEAA